MTINRWQADGILVFAAALWGFGNVAQKIVLEHLGPVTVVGLRCLIAAAVILPLLPRERAAALRPERSMLKAALPVALLFTLAALAQQMSFASLSVTNGSFLITTTAVMTPVAAWGLHRILPSATVWIAIGASLWGAFLMAGASLAALGPGDMMMLLSAALYAVWCVLLGDAVMRTRRPVALSLAQFAMAAIACTAAGLLLEHVSGAQVLAALPCLLALGGLATGLAFFLQTLAQQHTPASEAALLSGAESIFGMVGGMVFLREFPTLTEGTGAALIAGAVVMVQAAPLLRGAGRPAAPRPEPIRIAPPVPRMSRDRSRRSHDTATKTERFSSLMAEPFLLRSDAEMRRRQRERDGRR